MMYVLWNSYCGYGHSLTGHRAQTRDLRGQRDDDGCPESGRQVVCLGVRPGVAARPRGSCARRRAARSVAPMHTRRLESQRPRALKIDHDLTRRGGAWRGLAGEVWRRARRAVAGGWQLCGTRTVAVSALASPFGVNSTCTCRARLGGAVGVGSWHACVVRGGGAR